ncbi:uncharacterized protein RSE6_14211 [Rhynchosporium secalis]|uniref:Uncharacterized protein n=1 Tax=Rhynchosporium secalis TaxID=38038 RepID=A0A1E1MUR3_RHYSE|nr:uncharacterized protein RSE6_14211 [Rhynchosporium secalis]
MSYTVSIQAPVNMVVASATGLVLNAESIFTICYMLGCGKEVKRGDPEIFSVRLEVCGTLCCLSLPQVLRHLCSEDYQGL